MKMVPPLKFRPKLNGTPCQHQLNCAMCYIIIIFFKKKKKKKKKRKNKNKNFGEPFGGVHPLWPWGWSGHPHLAGLRVGSHPTAKWGWLKKILQTHFQIFAVATFL
jgi:hypothetical protein